MRFEELLHEAMTKDEEVVKAVARFYRGSFDGVVPAKEFGERYVLFDIPCYSFENDIRKEMDSFSEGMRTDICNLYAFAVAAIVPCHYLEDSNFAYRCTDPENINYYHLSWDTMSGYTIVPKKHLEKVLRKRGWM